MKGEVFNIFLSYRKFSDGVEIAQKVKTSLDEHYGKNIVFFDNLSINPSEKWDTVLEDALKNCDLFISLIHPSWQVERLFEDGDWVRREISIAIILNKPILPIYYKCSPPKSESLPIEIQKLSYIQGIKIDKITNECISVIASHIDKIFPVKIILHRKVEGLLEGAKCNTWKFRFNSNILMSLDGDEIQTDRIIPLGTYLVEAEWDEYQPGHPQLSGSRYNSKGKSICKFFFGPGIHHLTLKKVPNSDNRWLIIKMFTASDERKREIIRTNYLPIFK